LRTVCYIQIFRWVDVSGKLLTPRALLARALLMKRRRALLFVPALEERMDAAMGPL